MADSSSWLKGQVGAGKKRVRLRHGFYTRLHFGHDFRRAFLIEKYIYIYIQSCRGEYRYLDS